MQEEESDGDTEKDRRWQSLLMTHAKLVVGMVEEVYGKRGGGAMLGEHLCGAGEETSWRSPVMEELKAVTDKCSLPPQLPQRVMDALQSFLRSSSPPPAPSSYPPPKRPRKSAKTFARPEVVACYLKA